MKIGIVGGGCVGSATARAFSGFVDEVRVWDIVPERCSTPSIMHTVNSDLVFLCLPTPQKQGSLECDLTAVHAFFSSIAKRDANFVLRSTVPIGTTRALRQRYELPNLVHSPEFLTARTATFDAMMPARNIIGGTIDDMTNGYPESKASAMLYDLYERRWPHVPIHRMTSDESEAVKLFQNAFSAVKIATFNEFRCLADAKGLDWQRVMDGLLAGGWIAPIHTQVPGPDGRRGFGGACLVKDLANLVSHAKEEMGDMAMCRAAIERNIKDRLRE
jgi:UDPglucose 6-dehydrogenase